MRFLRYKQVCRLHFSGSDDELKNVGSSFYKSQENSIVYNDQVNTKLLRFRLDSKMKNIKLKNPKLVLESVTLKDLYTWDYASNSWGSAQLSNNNCITLRIKNIGGDNWDSTQNSEGNIILFNCSLIIYEEEEEELILKDGGNVVDFKRFGPTAQYKNIL